MKKRLILALMIGISVFAFAQTCSIPQPLTPRQKEMVTGMWSGYYDLNGKRTEFTVAVNFNSGAEAVVISNAPREGTSEGEEYRFCGAGAFHFKKIFTSSSFEFDGVPEGNTLNGTLVVVNGMRKESGKFQLMRLEE